VRTYSKNRDETYKAMTKTKAKDMAHFYNGKMPNDYATAFITKL